MRLTVLTYNIHHGVGTDGRLDLERIARVVEETSVDVVCLQEVDRCQSRSGRVDQPAWFAERLGMEVAFFPALTLARGGAGGRPAEYGNAILSRHPLTNAVTTPLPNHPGGEPRVLARADLLIPWGSGADQGGAVRIATTHLTHSSRSGRAAQAAALADLLPPTMPTILTGDLNAGPRAPELRELAARFTDVWPASGAGWGATHPARVPLRRIDHVLVAGGPVPAWARVRATTASDHRPVVAGLVLGAS